MTTVANQEARTRSIDWPTVLGTAGVGLGVAPVAAAGTVARAIGIEPSGANRLGLAAVGARELGVAAGLLSFPRRWMLWARVAGDAMDLGLLGRQLFGRGMFGRQVIGRGLFGRQVIGRGVTGRSRGVSSTRTLAATGAVGAIALVDLYAALKGARAESDVFASASTTIAKSPDEVYTYWRRLTDLPRFMIHLDSVESFGPTRSHWRATAPFGRTVEWDADIVDDVPGRHLSWRSTPDSEVHHHGRVEFKPAPGGQGTELRVTLRYRGVGVAARAVARYFGEEPRQHLDDDLRRFKQIMETGEVVRSDGALGGKEARREFPQRPAQPAGRADR